MTRFSLSGRAWAGLTAAFLVITALLVLTTVTLISQRQRTVLLNHQLGALVGEATLALHTAGPLLKAAPASTTIRTRADAAAGLVSQARPLIDDLRATDLPETLAAAGGLIDEINHDAVVPRLDALLAQVPAGAALIAQLRGVLTTVDRDGIVPGIAGGLHNLRALVALEGRSLNTQITTLRYTRSTHTTAQQTLNATRQALAQTRQILALARQTLNVAQQTLAHAASLDRKVGPVP